MIKDTRNVIIDVIPVIIDKIGHNSVVAYKDVVYKVYREYIEGKDGYVVKSMDGQSFTAIGFWTLLKEAKSHGLVIETKDKKITIPPENEYYLRLFHLVWSDGSLTETGKKLLSAIATIMSEYVIMVLKSDNNDIIRVEDRE